MDIIQSIALKESFDKIMVCGDNSFVVYPTSGAIGGMLAYDFNGNKLWQKGMNDNTHYRPYYVKNGKIYAELSICESDKRFQYSTIYDSKTGNELWKSDTKIDSHFVVDDTYIYSNYGKKIYCFDTSVQGKKNLVWKTQLSFEAPFGFLEMYGRDKDRVFNSPMKKSYKYLPCSYFVWKDFLVVPTNANTWFILDKKTGIICNEIVLNHDIIGKNQIYPEDLKSLYINNDCVEFIFLGTLIRINLVHASVDASVVDYQFANPKNSYVYNDVLYFLTTNDTGTKSYINALHGKTKNTNGSFGLDYPYAYYIVCKDKYVCNNSNTFYSLDTGKKYIADCDVKDIVSNEDNTFILSRDCIKILKL